VEAGLIKKNSSCFTEMETGFTLENIDQNNLSLTEIEAGSNVRNS